MSREYRPSVIYAKPDKTRSQQKYDPRDDAYHLYKYERPAAEQDHYNHHYGRYKSGHGQQTAKDHYNHHYRHETEYERRHGPQFLSNNRNYPVHVYQAGGRAQVSTGHGGHPSYYKDYRNHPLQELFQPPEGHKGVHAADVHAEPTTGVVEPGNEVPQPPDAPFPPEAPILVEDDQPRKPRKIREYRIRRKAADDPEDSASGSSDGEGDTISPAHGRERKHDKKDKKKGKAPPENPPPENWYTKTHADKYIKIGDITYIRARAHDKGWVQDLISAFEAFGFVVIGATYKGGTALLKIIAPVAAIKSYTELLSPALQTLVTSVANK